jgi:hypothetical protein
MATTKKEVIEEITEETKTADKKVAQKTNDLEAKMAQLTDVMAQMVQFVQTMAVAQSAQTIKTEHDGKIKIVHLAQLDPQLGTIIHLSNLDVGMTNFGDERLLTTQQFEELISKHRNWFTKGLLCVAKGYEKEAELYGVSTTADYPIDSTFIKTLGDIPMEKIEEVYKKLPEYGQENLVSYWLRCAYAGDKRFRDIRRAKTFDDITGGKLEGLLADLNRRPDNNAGTKRPNIVRY